MENRCIMVSIKIWSSTTVFNIDKQCFLSSESAYYYDFWRSCDTEDWSNDAENSALITGTNYFFKYFQRENSKKEQCNNISQYNSFYSFFV